MGLERWLCLGRWRKRQMRRGRKGEERELDQIEAVSPSKADYLLAELFFVFFFP